MKCILFGAGGREAIIAKELAKGYELYSFMSHANPTIIEATIQSGGQYIIDGTYSEDIIRSFIQDNGIELCVVNSDSLLEKGIVDIAKSCGVYTFGPTREGARIEWDKTYAISIIKKVAPESLVRTKIVSSIDELQSAVDIYEGADFVVKPNGLTRN
ncbi:MAG: hypothetical protein FWC53_03520 [Firmicutes bacterium]|nr:hypothetical protein [Bacillota bacterium]